MVLIGSELSGAFCLFVNGSFYLKCVRLRATAVPKSYNRTIVFAMGVVDSLFACHINLRSSSVGVHHW